MEELAVAVKDLHNNKSPGVDGIVIETYKVFWNDIKDLVYDSINYGIAANRSIDQRRGILSLIPQKDKDITQLKNWQRLSLLKNNFSWFSSFSSPGR